MTERQLWKTLGDAYATPRSKRTEDQKRMTFNGLCYGPRHMDAFSEHGHRMAIFIKQCIKDYHHLAFAYAYRDGSLSGADGYCILAANDKYRAIFCYLQFYRLGGK